MKGRDILKSVELGGSVGVETSNEDPVDEGRRALLKQGVVGAIYLALGSTISGLTGKAEAQEVKRKVLSARLENMPDHHMLPGYSRSRIVAHLTDNLNEEVVGSFFSMDDARLARADFIAAKTHPELFVGGQPNFEAIRRKHQHTVLLTAGAYLAPGASSIEGVALEKGQTVGENRLNENNKGFLVIKDGIPEIMNLNAFYNARGVFQQNQWQEFMKEAIQKKWSLFQQSSYIRHGGEFHSSKSAKWKLRFFVEIKGKKGFINFSKPMTYSEAVEVMKKIEIEKAIGLDTGLVEQGYFYDRNGNTFPMGDGGSNYTNLLVLYSGE